MPKGRVRKHIRSKWVGDNWVPAEMNDEWEFQAGAGLPSLPRGGTMKVSRSRRRTRFRTRRARVRRKKKED